MIHKVKSWTHLFQAAKVGVKTHDFRDATERDYKVGDQLLLQEFDFVKGEYTGEDLLVDITYITNRNTPCAMSSNGLAQDLCVLSICVVKRPVNTVGLLGEGLTFSDFTTAK